MTKYSRSGWHFQHIRHSKAKKYGKAGGIYLTKAKTKFEVKTVPTKILHDYAAMNHEAGNILGFHPLPNKNEILIADDIHGKEKKKTIVHEVTEVLLMRKGLSYWEAHIKALKAEKKV